MWNEMVKANWMRDSNSGSSSDIPASTRDGGSGPPTLDA
jgi:hypothetical protein